ncbi:hypothetical protein I312_103715 [Cryptococcus bacillisporus CA1280]|uniref:uncharacterized protein n=1 Tax=Cryptococcus bacillisporus CA1280 TaxID=1296109 RepID=UPI0033697167
MCATCRDAYTRARAAKKLLLTDDKIDLSAQIKSSPEISNARTAGGIHNRLQDSDKSQDDVDDILDTCFSCLCF